MFGCLAIYVKDKIVLILRDEPETNADNGVWLATTQEDHQSLRREFPNMRSIQVLGKVYLRCYRFVAAGAGGTGSTIGSLFGRDDRLGRNGTGSCISARVWLLAG
jgi:hypothetical protein